MFLTLPGHRQLFVVNIAEVFVLASILVNPVPVPIPVAVCVRGQQGCGEQQAGDDPGRALPGPIGAEGAVSDSGAHYPLRDTRDVSAAAFSCPSSNSHCAIRDEIPASLRSQRGCSAM